MQGRAKIVGEGPAQFTVSAEPERPFPKAGVKQYSVTATGPPGAPAGNYQFHLLVMNVANPEEEYMDGPAVGYQVTEIIKHPPPWWWRWRWLFVLAGVVLLVLIGVLTYVLWP